MSVETLAPPKPAKTKASASSSSAARSTPVTPTVSPKMRQAMIAEAAYFRALHRNFVAGSELDDWLLGEQQIMQQIQSK